MHRAVLALISVAALAAAPRLAHADAKAEARAHLARATELHGEGRFAEVLTELTTAYALDPQPDILYAIAQIHVALGDCPQAITFYRRFLSTHPARLPADAAREAIDVCEHTPATPPAGTGTDLGTGTDAGPFDSGVADAPPTLRTNGTPDQPTDTATGSGTGPGADTGPGGAAGAVAGPELVASPSRPRWYHDRLGVSLVGGGVLLGVGAAVTYGLARADLDDAEGAPTYAGYLDLVDRGHQRRMIASVLAGGAIAATAFGAFHVWRHGRAAELALAPGRGGGVVSWTGHF